MQNELLWFWFSNIPGLGYKSRSNLLHYFHTPESLWHLPESKIKDYITDSQLSAWLKSKNKDKILEDYHKLEREHVTFLSPEHALFPKKLKNIPWSPHGLYLKGKLPERNLPLLAIVGSRTPTEYGKSMTRYFASEASKAGIGIISGLASGIDTLSHQTALTYQQYTLGILGGGIDTIYPRDNFNLYYRMYAEGGVLSEYNLGVPNHPGLFPARNRLISGMADAVLIVEAAQKSGTLITADHALEQGKDIYVIPGRITDTMSKGCNNLIFQGAHPACNPQELCQDILDKYAIQSRFKSAYKEKTTWEENVRTELEERIMACLDQINPKSVNEILCYLTREKQRKDQTSQACAPIPPLSDLLNELLMMEIKQSVTKVGQGLYVKNY